jgi:uncharacterized protein YxeA
MKKASCNKKTIYFILIILVLIALWVIISKKTSKEGFVPFVNRLYRPHVRNFKRFVSENFVSTNKYANNFLKKAGIL